MLCTAGCQPAELVNPQLVRRKQNSSFHFPSIIFIFHLARISDVFKPLENKQLEAPNWKMKNGK